MSGSSQNIETISTQFRILSTVKATMLSKFVYSFLTVWSKVFGPKMSFNLTLDGWKIISVGRGIQHQIL